MANLSSSVDALIALPEAGMKSIAWGAVVALGLAAICAMTTGESQY